MFYADLCKVWFIAIGQHVDRPLRQETQEIVKKYYV